MKRLWQSQPAPTTTEFAVEDLHRMAQRFHRRVVWRNAIEYLACAAVVLAFTFYLVKFPFPLMRVGSVLVIFGALTVAWQLRTRASTQQDPGDRGARSWIDFHRAQLVRQRNALRSVLAWYIGPFLPGVVVFRWGVETELGGTAPFAGGLFANLIMATVFVVVILLNRHAAHKLQLQLDRLDQEAR